MHNIVHVSESHTPQLGTAISGGSNPLVVQPPSADAVIANNYPELALAAMQQVVGQNVANMAMASHCAPKNLSEIQIISGRWRGSSRRARTSADRDGRACPA
jgi:hypothetical protein